MPESSTVMAVGQFILNVCLVLMLFKSRRDFYRELKAHSTTYRKLMSALDSSIQKGEYIIECLNLLRAHGLPAPQYESTEEDYDEEG